MKKIVSALLGLITVTSCCTNVLAMEPKQNDFALSENSIGAARGSYTYKDLGTRTEKFSSHNTKMSVAAIAAGITGGCTLSYDAALKAANAVYFVWEFFSDGTIYYTVKIHTTQVFLDGEFSHYIIESKTYAYANSNRTDLVTTDEHTGTSLSPMSLPV